MKGFTNKQPKIVAASIDVMKRALRCVFVRVCARVHMCACMRVDIESYLTHALTSYTIVTHL